MKKQRLIHGAMMMLAATRLAAVLLIAIAVASSANGQQQYRGHRQSSSQVPRYTPSSPTVSPYLSLLNRNGGGAVSNYYGLVRPLQRQQSFNEQQSQETTNQDQQIRRIHDEQQGFEQPTVKPTGTAGWFQNLGQRPPYQVASHYYGQWQERGKGSRRQASPRHF